jgi:hypothetical protein
MALLTALHSFCMRMRARVSALLACVMLPLEELHMAR